MYIIVYSGAFFLKKACGRLLRKNFLWKKVPISKISYYNFFFTNILLKVFFTYSILSYLIIGLSVFHSKVFFTEIQEENKMMQNIVIDWMQDVALKKETNTKEKTHAHTQVFVFLDLLKEEIFQETKGVYI